MLVSNRLPLFKKKNDTLYNCRCIICGDSVKNRNKARGYFFPHKTDFMYKCHNCDTSMAFSTFLKRLDQLLYSQYTLEKYSEGKPISIENSLKFDEPVFKTKEQKVIDDILQPLNLLPEDNEAVQFCTKRKIPKDKFNLIYYIDNIKKIVQLNDKYSESIKGEEPRLVLPFYDNNNELSGVTCRALRGEALRYITVKIKEDAPLIFGLDRINKNSITYVVEGPIDSLFLDNCIAAAGTTFGKVDTLGLNNVVMIFDNQPRNKDVVSSIEKNIDKGYNVVIWPQTIEEKDINDMVLAGKNVQRVVKENTFSGLVAKAKLYSWKRV